MDGLRWLLLLFGVLVIAGVYLYSRREKETRESRTPVTRRVTPSLGGDNLSEETSGQTVDDRLASPGAVEVEDRLPIGPGSEDGPPDERPLAPQKIVTLRIVARETKAFPGDELILSMRGIGLRHGKFGIFHAYDGNDETKTVFSAASLIEPGSFDLQNIKEQSIPGISLFLVLPGPTDSVDAFDRMMTAARALTQTLKGELLDESGSSLSIQRERYMREEIIQYQHSILVA